MVTSVVSLDFDVSAVAVAIIAGIATVGASAVAGYFAYKAAKRVKTSNGHDTGELTEFIAEEIAWLRINLMEQMKAQENQRISFMEHIKDQEQHRSG